MYNRTQQDLLNYLTDVFNDLSVNSNLSYKISSNGEEFEVNKNGKNVTVKTKDKSGNEQVGVATCHNDDKFNFAKGLDIALHRLNDKNYATEENFKPYLKFEIDDFYGEKIEQPVGHIGDKTNLVDINNKPLHIGDVVEVYWLKKPTSYEKVNERPTLHYVVDFGEGPTIAGYLAITIEKNEENRCGWTYDNSNKIEYIYRLVKSYKQLSNNETYGNLKAVTTNPDAKKEEIKLVNKNDISDLQSSGTKTLTKEEVKEMTDRAEKNNRILVENYRKLANDYKGIDDGIALYYTNLANNIEKDCK